MLQTHRRVALVCGTVFAVGADPGKALADIKIGQPKNHVASVQITGCTGYTGKVDLTPDPIEYLAPAKAGGLLDKTFIADEPTQFKDWTLNFAGVGLGGMLSVKDYLAVTGFGQCMGGAELNATYELGSNDPEGLTFIQMFSYKVDKKGDAHRSVS